MNYSQNFNTLSSPASTTTGLSWTNNSTIVGWYLFNKDNTAITTYGAENGNSGNATYNSYGASSNTERALGSLGSGGTYWGSPSSGSVAGYMALALTNATGSTINSITVRFNGEQWRNGGNTTAQSMSVQYGFGATFSSVTTWNNTPAGFSFTSPVATATAAAVDGNVAGRVNNLGGSLNSIGWTSGSTLWIRWVENNDAGNDHALAIDDLTFSAYIGGGAIVDGGVNFVGRINGYSQPINCTGGDYRVLNYRRVSATSGNPVDGRGQWFTTVNVQSSGGNVTPDNMPGGGGAGFLFTSGGGCGNTGTYLNKWNFGGVGQASLDAVNLTSLNNSTDMGLNMGTAGRYTFVMKDVYNTNGPAFYVGFTTNDPVTLTHNTATQQPTIGSGSATITATLSTTPSTQEKFYLRYRATTNDLSTSTSQVLGTVSGTTVTFNLSGLSSSTTYYYYVLSTTNNSYTSLSEVDKSLCILNFADNAGSNYSFTTAVQQYTITASAGANGSISPSGTTTLNSGGNQTYTIAPGSSCYRISSLTVNGNPASLTTGSFDNGGTYVFNNVTANQTIDVTFALKTYTVTVSAGANGSISPGTGSVNCGDNATYTITPNAGFYISDVQINGVSNATAKANGSYTFSNVTSNQTISASFAPLINYIYHEATTNNPGCGPDYRSVLTPNSTQSLSLAWKIEYQNLWNQSRIYYTTDGSTPSGAFGAGSGTTQVVNGIYNCGIGGSPNPEVVTGTIPAQPAGTTVKYIISAWNSNGGTELFANSGNCNGCGAKTSSTDATVFSYTVLPATYTIAASAGAGGSISPSGSVSVTENNNQNFTITANSGFVIGDVLVNGSSVGAVGTYTFTNVTANQTISAGFLPTTFGFYNLQFPGSATISQGNNITAFAQYYIAGVTDVSSDAAPGVNVWIGYSTTNTDPSSGGFTWVPATFNPSSGTNNNDEYQASFGSSLAPGTYYYASRFQRNGGDYYYGGFNGGPWNGTTNVNGVLTINPAGFNIVSSAGAGGTISPNGTTLVGAGTDQSYTITPNSGFIIGDVLVNGVSQGAISSYTFTNVQTTHTISASFLPTTIDYANLQFPGSATVTRGTNINVFAQVYKAGITDAPGAGSGLSAWIGYSSTNENPNSTSFTWIPANFNTQVGNNDEFIGTFGASLPAGTYYYASRFQLNGGAFYYGGFNGGFWNGTGNVNGVLTINPVTYTITATAGTGGSISPSGSVTVNENTNQSFSITAASGYEINDVLVNNVSQGAISSYTFNNVTANQSISAIFKKVAIEYANLQFPANATINTGGSMTAYARVYVAGVTDAVNGQGPGISAWIGYSSNNTDPSGSGWTWVPATFNQQFGNDDEYQASFGSDLPAGTYYYASRFQINGGAYYYGGYTNSGGGFWGGPNVSGVLTVNCTVPTAPSISANGVTTFCAGGSVTLTSTSATGNTWSTGATTQSITVSGSGTYSVTFTDGFGCVSVPSNAITVTVNPIPAKPTISASGSTTICSGNSVTLTSSSTTGNLWSTGETTQSIVVTTAGSYTVKVTLNNCESPVSDATTVTVNSFGGSSGTEVFAETMGTTTASSIAAYETANSFDNDNHTMSGSTGVDIRTTVSSAGLYTGASGSSNVFITSTSGLNFQIAGINTLGASNLALSFGIYKSTTSSNGSDFVVEVSSDGINYTPLTYAALPTGSGTATWYLRTASGSIPSTANLRIRFRQTGSTTQYRIDDVVLTKSTGASASIGADGPITFCTPGSVVLTATPAASYLWSNGATTQSITVTTSGSFSCILTDANGCTATSNTIVTNAVVSPTVTITNPSAVCAPATVDLTAAAITNGSGSNLSFTYFTNAGATTILNNPDQVAASGTYYIKGTDNTTGCFDIKPVIVIVNPRPAITTGANPAVCIGTGTASISYSAPLNTPDKYSIVWSSSATNAGFTDITLENLPASPISVTIPGSAAPGAYTGTLTVTNSATGCTSVDYPVSITINTVTAVASNNGPLCEGQSLQLTALPGSQSKYVWSGPNGFSNIATGTTFSESFATTSATGWSLNSVPVSASQACASNGLLFNGTGDFAITPAITNPNKLNFKIRRSGDATTWSVNVQISSESPVSQTSGPWTTVATVGSTVTTTCTSVSEIDLSAYPGTRYIRFIDTRASGANERGIDEISVSTFTYTQNPVINNVTAANAGTYSLTVTGTNSCTSTTTTEVVIKTAPVISNYENITVNADPGNCNAVVSYLPATVTGSPTPAVSYSHVSGSTFPVGTTTVTINATNDCGNVSKTFTVTVVDNQDPVITLPTVAPSYNTDNGTCSSSQTFAASATDNCTVATIKYYINYGTSSQAEINFPYNFPVGSTSVTVVATDVNGRSATNAFTVNITDTEAPVLVDPADVTGTNDAGKCYKVVVLTAPVASDNCGIAVAGVTATGIPADNKFPVGTTTVTWSVTDIHGNTTTQSQDVTITDTEAPVLVDPADVTGTNDAGKCYKVVVLTAPVASDNCGIAVAGVTATGIPADNKFPVGTTTVTWSVTDIHGNTTTQSQDVTITDTEAPVLVDPADVTGTNDAGKCYKVVVLTAPVASDNCGIAVAGVTATGIPADNKFPVGTTTVTWSVTDIHGNTTTQSQDVTITDTEAPVLVDPADVTGTNDAGKCYKVVVLTAPVASDNCGIAVAGVTATGIPADNKFPVGTTTVTWSVTDIHGNTTTQSQDVTITDTEAPNVITRPVTIYLNASGIATTTAAAVNNGSTDNCGIATITLSKTSFNCSNVGTNNVVLIITDIHGNTASANAVVTVVDNIPPTAVCKNIIVFLGASGSVSIAGNALENGSTDNCSIPVNGYSLSQNVFTAAGVYNVTMTVTDVNGNSSTCTATVSVNKRPVTVTYTGDASEQYSDVQTLTARLTDNLAGGAGIAGRTVTFTIGSQTVSAVTNTSGIATASLTLNQNPDLAYTVAVSFAGDGTYLQGSDSDPFDILDEDARVDYTGTQFAATANVSSSTATVLLSATVSDITAITNDAAYDAFAGDIRNARVRFVVVETGQTSNWLTPVLVNNADTKTGTVSSSITLNIGNANSQSYTVRIEVDGYYTQYPPENGIVTVYKPLSDFVTGGGHIIPTASAGTYASTPGLKMNFGLNVKYNKQGTNLQGGVNMIFRRLVNGTIRTYQIKSNSMTSLGTSGTTGTTTDRYAEFLSKANLTDITDPLNTISLGGNLDLRVSMRDRGEPGSSDEIGVTLFNPSGGLLFSSNWVSSRTVRLLLRGGNIVISGGNVGTPIVRVDGPGVSVTPPVTSAPLNQHFNVKVLGNPTFNKFVLKLESSDVNSNITLKVVDAAGRIVEVKQNLRAGQVIELGDDYRLGTYFVEAVQGTERRTVKLMKVER
ncbi:HYR domain-containing protein [Lacibacter sp. MH-610]|uniref:beta strand repeat-containing protein n=1 Tax=Lacibacter sp. MH-610 TaxID=3020883 RepID=UPI00389166D2